MNPEMQSAPVVHKSRKVLTISLVTFILLMLAITAQFTFSILKNDNIYKGVYIDNIYVGSLSIEGATNVLNKHFQYNANRTEITLKTKSITEKFSFSDIDVVYNVKNAINRAHDIGRTGNIFERLYTIYKTGKENKKVELSVTFDKNAVDSIIHGLYNKTLIPVKEADLLLQEGKVTIRSGYHGESIDKAKILAEAENLINTCKGGIIDIPIIITPPSKIDIDGFYSQITLNETNATFKVENNAVKVIPHIIGRKIEKSSLASIISRLEKTENTEEVLPVDFITPEITTEIANASLFRDVLDTRNTHFSTSNVNDSNRGENISLAVSKINDLILAPGDVFSFNQAVGKRTEEGGYKTAHVYVGGKVIDGIGGGICQVSTTLYNTVLYSDLEVIERRNHMFTVGYVPKGLDATVSYGEVDFKFKNSTGWPIKIEGKVTKSNTIVFSLVGTNETPGKKVEMVPEIIKTVDFEKDFFDDPTLAEGTTQVRQTGREGYVVDTYKIIKQNGKVVNQTKIHTSTYRPLNEEILRGTLKAAAPLTEPPAPPPTITGVDDADNPPAEDPVQ